ncbi:MAG: alpha-L-rhamnosidase N-terminal domain-containing protein [Verrucomicrobiota bacterium]
MKTSFTQYVIICASLFATTPLVQRAVADGTSATTEKLSAKWIWHAQSDYHGYNQTVLARKTVKVSRPTQGTLRVTADSWYRLFINGRWVNDGPCRSWPEHYQYDVLDVGAYLQEGANDILIIARYFGVGDFHKVPQQAGLLAQLDVTQADGQAKRFITDGSWEIADAKAWVVNTPKISIQMEPVEIYDARLANDLKYSKARELFPAEGGPWKGLNPRDVALMTRQPFAFKTFGGAKVVKADGWNYTLSPVRLMQPGLIEANHNASGPCGMAAILETEQGCTLNVQLEGMKLAVNGQAAGNKEIKLAPGKHLVLAFIRSVVGHDKDKAVRFMNPRGFKLVNPLDAKHENPWCFIPLPEYVFATNDLMHGRFIQEDVRVSGLITKYQETTDKLLREIKNPTEFAANLAAKAQVMASEAMFPQDFYWQFVNRQVVRDAATLVKDPAALMHQTPEITTVQPAPDGDVELMYDLGEQNCGYYTFDLTAPAGTVVDICGMEYITPEGRLQFAMGNRNGMRYITREGVNQFTSLKRRSGRYVFMTLRNQRGPVQIRHFGLIESTYPVNAVGNFSCSDARLDNIWAISTRTLKLCMEDTFTDCPLYEQTHWVGDARNESLLAYPVFGATDIGRRCIQITGQSLEHYPFAGCQTPSCWDVLIPAWSFLWGISTWDYYWYTGDKVFLRQAYPDVIRNLKGAEKYVNAQDLFSGPFWNFFDWTKMDAGHKTVTYNTMLMIGAIDAARKDAETLGDTTHDAWLKQLRARLVRGVNKLWDTPKKAYVDSVHDDGTVSTMTSQHTSFLAILYDIIEPANLDAARNNLIAPPEKMVRVGSPFAALYELETLEKLGLEDRIVEEIYRNYLPMLESGATTVWESFPSGTTGSGGFPTRSHCHAWSSAPSFFLNRIVLGIKPTAPAAQTVALSPRIGNLTWARGTVATIKGPLTVSWKLQSDKALDITCTAPEGVKVEFATNPSLTGKTVKLNGQKVQ